jgi:hypothetical protein
MHPRPAGFGQSFRDTLPMLPHIHHEYFRQNPRKRKWKIVLKISPLSVSLKTIVC